MKPVRYFIGAILMAAVLTGCHTRIEPYYPRENRPGNSGESQNTEKEKELVLTQNKTWTITYAGRKVVRGETVEDIRVTNVPAGQKFLVSVINRPSYASYEGDLAAFFKNELAECGDYVYLFLQI